ncbi:folliculin-interacting protein N-terminus-domain-containing protein [Phyllosticta paracitricarpa]|uniref:Folliculin-interacting protein N-terminus-domain-containing protein n=1 Tax=Phyllosticta paracitricarpa TaxID=2016321 RepID=A0ABR1N221_9PEZI
MLGQLLHSFNPNRRGPARQPNNVLESVTEDSHTYNLLFPDATQLANSDAQAFPLNPSSSNASTYDASQAGIDLDQNRDIRIIIAQDEAGAMARTVLFDSKPNSPSVDSPNSASDRRGSRQGPSSYTQSAFAIAHGRRASLALDRNSPQPATSAFQRARSRNASISGMPHIEEGAAQRRSKEAEELVNTCMECMFGSAPWSYRGTSSKLHILPMESRTSDRSVTSPILGEGYSSFGRAEGRKRSGLATSFTPSNFPEPQTANNGLPEATQKEARRRTILITRLFSVSPPEDVETPAEANSNTTTPTPGTSVGTTNSFPFPHVGTGSTQGSIRKGPKPQYRTPMYAIGILLHLPVATSPNRPGGAHKADRGQDSLGSSFDSERRAGWAFLDASTGESLLNAANSDVDDRVDVIGQHWDVITRTLAHLHFVVQRKIVELFKLQEASTPQLQTPSRPCNGIRNGYREMPMSRRSLMLQGHALQFEPEIKTVVESSAERVVRGMKIPRVVTGQGRWGVWREEARWLGRWAGAKEQNFFLFNLLTAFLGTHTEWLNVAAPKSYRTKHRAQQKMNAGDDMTVSSRTVLVSPDKMAARRLIFLLATFLPASSHAVYDGASPARPSTAASARGYSQSPPSNATLSRQQSLRRAINKKGHKSYPNMSVLNVAEGTSQSKEGNADDRPPSRSAPHSRRPSEVRSIRSVNTTGLTIPSMAEDGGARKGNTTTTSTATPDSAVPVAHFAVQRTGSIASGSSDPRPPSSGSLASVNLRQNLQRTSTANTSNQSVNSGSSKGWSSLINFWSNGSRRESSNEHGEILQSTDDGLGISGPYRRPYNHSNPNKLEQMVQELQLDEEEEIDESASVDQGTTPLSPSAPPTAARAIPPRAKQVDSPLKLSVNENDGVIDIDIPLPGFGSPVQSPLMPNMANSCSSLEGSTFGPSCCSSTLHSADAQHPANVAGWLARFHQDFALQGVNPYPDLEKDIKKAMSAEPTPSTAVTTPTMESGPTEKWVHICTTLVADARNFSVKRIHLKRRVRLIPTPSQPPSLMTPGSSSMHTCFESGSARTPGPGSLPKSQYGNPYGGSFNGSSMSLPLTELHMEERFVEEPVMDLDETLVEAIERSVSLGTAASSSNGHAIYSPHHSVSASTSNGSLRDSSRDGAAAAARNDCKTAVLGALEQIAKSVAAERVVAAATGGVGGVVSVGVAHKESTLREGVRRWLGGVDALDASSATSASASASAEAVGMGVGVGGAVVGAGGGASSS